MDSGTDKDSWIKAETDKDSTFDKVMANKIWAKMLTVRKVEKAKMWYAIEEAMKESKTLE